MSGDSEFGRRTFIGICWAVPTLATTYLGAHAIWPEQTDRFVGAARDKIDPAPSPVLGAQANRQEGCVDIINSLTLEEKVGALILPMAGVKPVQGVSNGSLEEIDSLEKFMLDRKISAFTSYNLKSEVISGGQSMPVGQALIELIGRVSAARNMLPVEYALDIEGGNVKRDDALPGSPQLLAASEQGSPAEIVAAVKQEGIFLKSLGVTTIFGPVADVGTQGPIGRRAYGDTANVVQESVGAAIDGWRAAANPGERPLKVTLKHFPGHGRADADSHESLPITPSYSELQAVDLPPFASTIQTKNPEEVMMGHLIADGVTEQGTPASLSPSAYSLLKTGYGFTGVATTDALDMGAINVYLNNKTGRQMEPQAAEAMAAALAIQAGADRVIVTLGAANQVADTLVNAVSTGTIPMDRLHDAVARVYRGKGVVLC